MVPQLVADRAVFRVVLVSLLASAGACSSAPDGFLGAEWGDEPGAALQRLGTSCDEWREWTGGGGFEVCEDGTVTALGHTAAATVVRRGGALEGFQLRFDDCAAYRDDLVRALAEELGVEEGVTYQVWSSGEAVHLEDVGAACALTVAGPAFGDAFQSYRMSRGLGGLRLGP